MEFNSTSSPINHHVKLQLEDLDAPPTCVIPRHLTFCLDQTTSGAAQNSSTTTNMPGPVGFRYPNLLGHRAEIQAANDLNKFKGFLDSPGRCGVTLRAFVCSLYAPLCSVALDTLQPPCRDICISAHGACFRAFERRGRTWPPEWTCGSLPSVNSGLCLVINSTSINTPEQSNVSHASVKQQGTRNKTKKQQKTKL